MNENVETLLCRVIGREDAPADWRSLRDVARSAPDLWSRLADDLEADAALRARIVPALAVADRVELPAPARVPFAWRGSLGWLCAAAIALAWLWSVRPGSREGTLGTGTLETGLPVAAAEAGGVAVGELPRVVLRSRPVGSGVEVLYMRRLVERATVRELQQLHRDEAGLPFAAPVQTASWRPPESF
jgi:hypothetical protein